MISFNSYVHFDLKLVNLPNELSRKTEIGGQTWRNMRLFFRFILANLLQGVKNNSFSVF